MLAFICADNYEVDLEVASQPELEGKPLLISHGDRLRGIVKCCSSELLSSGVSLGDRVSNVRRKMPHVVVLPERQSHYEKMSRNITALLINHTPALERSGMSGWMIDLTGCDRLLDNDFLGWARQISSLLKNRFGVTIKVGLGSNKVTAELACRLAQRGSGFRLYQDGESSLLERASLDILPALTHIQREYLHEKRLHWVWEIKELGEDRLRQWFGSRDGSRIWSVIHGQCQEPVKPYKVPRMLRKTYTFPQATASMQDIIPAGVLLVGNLCHDVRKLGGILRRISCHLLYSDDHSLRREIHVAELRREEDFAEAVTRMLENLPLRRVQVRSLSLGCPVDFEMVEQQDLFSERERIKRQELDQALREIREKYGFQLMHRASGTVRPRFRTGR